MICLGIISLSHCTTQIDQLACKFTVWASCWVFIQAVAVAIRIPVAHSLDGNTTLVLLAVKLVLCTLVRRTIALVRTIATVVVSIAEQMVCYTTLSIWTRRIPISRARKACESTANMTRNLTEVTFITTISRHLFTVGILLVHYRLIGPINTLLTARGEIDH